MILMITHLWLNIEKDINGVARNRGVVMLTINFKQMKKLIKNGY